MTRRWVCVSFFSAGFFIANLFDCVRFSGMRGELPCQVTLKCMRTVDTEMKKLLIFIFVVLKGNLSHFEKNFITCMRIESLLVSPQHFHSE